MKQQLNETPAYVMSLEAVDSVDRLITARPEIPGLQFGANEETGFTYIDEVGDHTVGLRSKMAGDSGYSYYFAHARTQMDKLHTAHFTREGYLLYLTYSTVQLEEIPALTVISGLAKLIRE